MNNKFTTKNIALYGILMALTTVATMVISIPSIQTKGYVNLGDGAVLLSALILGIRGGFLVGGIGSALADLLLGYVHFVPITFVVKGIEGILCAAIFIKLGKKKPLVATVIAGLWMALGYFVAEIFMYSLPAAVASLPGNIIQGLVGAVAGAILYFAVIKVKPDLAK